MASITSRSPNGSSPYEFDSAGETDESWQYIDYNAGSTPSSIGFLSDPASGSLSSFAVIGNVHGNTPSPSAASPLLLGEMDQSAFFPSNTSFVAQSDPSGSDIFSTAATGPSIDGGFAAAEFMTPQQYLFPQQDPNQFSPQELNGMLAIQRPGSQSSQAADHQADMAPLMNAFQTDLFPTTSDGQPQVPQIDFNIPQILQADANVPPWNPTDPRGTDGNMFIMDDFSSSSPQSINSHNTSSPGSRASPGGSRSPPMQIRKVKVGKVEKKKTEQSGKFVIMTPTSISAHAGRPNPYECFEAMRTSQRGRKGPLANATKENALQVRRLGACFCCHSRKVKCDKERPCKSCKKLMVTTPQVVCWQFSNFLPILFPDFIRGHFRKEEMSKFISENIEGFAVNGVEKTCSVELFSGPLFSTVLAVDAKFFTPATCDVVQHWHMSSGSHRMNLQSNGSAAIGIEFETGAQRDSLKKRTRKYIQDIVAEPHFAVQVTDSIYTVELPRKILSIVKDFAEETDSLMVRRALSIYCMHYTMTRHLCLTADTVNSLGATGLVPQNVGPVTPRVLARQIKSIIDEMMMREMNQLFELFSKSLKPKSRREWAPCLAAFLTLCLFMEAVEAAADVFVVTQNQIGLRNGSRPEYDRGIALNTCKEVENMPFRQFAYQFHQVYQTHTKEANAKSFNPLFDIDEQGELDAPAAKLTAELKELYFGNSWLELQMLTEETLLPNNEPQLYPRDPQILYTGRLVARFLMSFQDEKFIWLE
ncbi:hypothetical protein B0J13DRAFT_7555 [Dactylonectria estremocensis]|uniref:Zn(2)-C6 fungal-type domain-containing protein n=1 Tax=Dactylonectria estremocensis TaxID=1079267 RepID=A0A9P9FIZ5_9HYPO|nr:hypothetical protein B0J13DRAFT_7555 [Dactylonectria estremocensis]